ncbi:uncharacterized protein LOC128884441 isoform X2 [Hylaeus volcanicus]|uniref:uncharacterized protein LOC128884441 isoform X2 n=1 Tax=Hylaeus volcanicus TaxID=313075 RepID=UPI0023B86CB8|nr:uncharacterized protein LOC128884441 isoform X2 [Hylaeus volcanicus]
MILINLYISVITTTFFNKNALACIASKIVDSNSTLHTLKQVSDPISHNFNNAVEDANLGKREALAPSWDILPSSSGSEQSIESANKQKLKTLGISRQFFEQLSGVEFTNWPDDIDCTNVYEILSSPYMKQFNAEKIKKNISIPSRCLPRTVEKQTFDSRASPNMDKSIKCQQPNLNSISKNQNSIHPIVLHKKNPSMRRALGSSNVRVSINLNVQPSDQRHCRSHVLSDNQSQTFHPCHQSVPSSNKHDSSPSEYFSRSSGGKQKTRYHDESSSLSHPVASNIHINIAFHISKSPQKRNKCHEKVTSCSHETTENDSCNQKSNDKSFRGTSNHLPCPLLLNNTTPKLHFTQNNSTDAQIKKNACVLDTTKNVSISSNGLSDKHSSETLHKKNTITTVLLQNPTHSSQAVFSEEKINVAINGSYTTKTDSLLSMKNETLQKQKQQSNETTDNGDSSCLLTRILEKNNFNTSKAITRVFEKSSHDVSLDNHTVMLKQQESSHWNSTLSGNFTLPCHDQDGEHRCDKNMTQPTAFSFNTQDIRRIQNISLKGCHPSDMYSSAYGACKHEHVRDHDINDTSTTERATHSFSNTKSIIISKSEDNFTSHVISEETQLSNTLSKKKSSEVNMSNETQSYVNHTDSTMRTESDSMNTSSSQVGDVVSKTNNETFTTQDENSVDQGLTQHTTIQNAKDEISQMGLSNEVHQNRQNVSVFFSKKKETTTSTTNLTNIAINSSEKRYKSTSFINTTYQAELESLARNRSTVNSTEKNETIRPEVTPISNGFSNRDVKNSTLQLNASELFSWTHDFNPFITSGTDFLSIRQDDKENQVISSNDLKDIKNINNSITSVSFIPQPTSVVSKTEFLNNSQAYYETNDINLNKYISNCIERMSLEKCLHKLRLQCSRKSSEAKLEKTTSVALEEKETKREPLRNTEIQPKRNKVEYYTTQPMEKYKFHSPLGIPITPQDNRTNVVTNRSTAQLFPEFLNTSTNLTQKKINIFITYPLWDKADNKSLPPETAETLFTFANSRETDVAINKVETNIVASNAPLGKLVNLKESTATYQPVNHCNFPTELSSISSPCQSSRESDTRASSSKDSADTWDKTRFLKLNNNATDSSNRESQSSLSNSELRKDESQKNTSSCKREEYHVQTEANLSNCNGQVERNTTEIYKGEEKRDKKHLDNSSTNGAQSFVEGKNISTWNEHSSIQKHMHNTSFTKNATTQTFFQSSDIQKESELKQKQSNVAKTSVVSLETEETVTNQRDKTSEKLLHTVAETSVTNTESSLNISKDFSQKWQNEVSGSHKALEHSRSESSGFNPQNCATDFNTSECIEFHQLHFNKTTVLHNELPMTSLGEGKEKHNSRWINTNTNCSFESKPMKYYSYDGEQCDFGEEDTVVEFEEDTKHALVRFSKDELKQSSIQLESLDDTIDDDIVFIPCVTIRSRKTSNVISHASASPINASTLKNSSSLINALKALNLLSLRNSTLDRYDGAVSVSNNSETNAIPPHIAEKLYKLKQIMNSEMLQVQINKQNSNKSSGVSDVLHQNNQTTRRQQTVRIVAKNDGTFSQLRIEELKKKNMTIDDTYRKTTEEESVGQTHATISAEANKSLNETLLTTEESDKTSETLSVLQKKPVQLILAGIAITAGFLLIFFLVNFSLAKTADIEDNKFLTSCIPLNEDDKSLPFSACRETFVDVENTSFL